MRRSASDSDLLGNCVKCKIYVFEIPSVIFFVFIIILKKKYIKFVIRSGNCYEMMRISKNNLAFQS